MTEETKSILNAVPLSVTKATVLKALWGKKIKQMRNNENNSAVTSPCPTARFLITLLPMLRLNSELVSL